MSATEGTAATPIADHVRRFVEGLRDDTKAVIVTDEMSSSILGRNTRAFVADALDSKLWSCGAQRQGTAGGNEPADCNWPMCGCDPYAGKVMRALDESGMLKTQT